MYQNAATVSCSRLPNRSHPLAGAFLRKLQYQGSRMQYPQHARSLRLPRPSQLSTDAQISATSVRQIHFSIHYHSAVHADGPTVSGQEKNNFRQPWENWGPPSLHRPYALTSPKKRYQSGRNASFSSKIWSIAQTGRHTTWKQRSTVGADDNGSDCTWRWRNKTLITLEWWLTTVALQLTFPQIYYRYSVRKGNTMKMYSSSSSIGTTARCGLWTVEQYPSIFFYPFPTFPTFSIPALEDLFLSLFPSFPGSSPSPRPFQLLSEDLFGHPILLHSLQVTKPTYPLPFYPLHWSY